MKRQQRPGNANNPFAESTNPFDSDSKEKPLRKPPNPFDSSYSQESSYDTWDYYSKSGETASDKNPPHRTTRQSPVPLETAPERAYYYSTSSRPRPGMHDAPDMQPLYQKAQVAKTRSLLDESTTSELDDNATTPRVQDLATIEQPRGRDYHTTQPYVPTTSTTSSQQQTNNKKQRQWDSDAQFPILEIQRIKNKTQKLRQKNSQEEEQAHHQADNSTDAIFRPEQQQQVRTTTTTTSAPPPLLPPSFTSSTSVVSKGSTSLGGSVRKRNHEKQPKRKKRHHLWVDTDSAGESSLGDVLDRNYDEDDDDDDESEAAAEGVETPLASPRGPQTNESISLAAKSARRNLMHSFASPAKRDQSSSTDPRYYYYNNNNTSNNNNSSSAVQSSPHTSSSNSSSMNIKHSNDNNTPATSSLDDTNTSSSPNLALHDLCGEAVSMDDVAWRNALYLLSSQPALAAVVDTLEDGQGWTPLHICGLGEVPAPAFMTRALLYAHPAAARWPDQRGCLPLHLVAASSADCATMQLLVEEYPQAVHQVDAVGLIPLHLLLRNTSVELTAERVRILLGWSVAEELYGVEQRQQRRRVLQRRGQHLQLPLEQLEEWRTRDRPVTNFNRDVAHEAEFENYPMDVQMAFRDLAHWKHRQGRPQKEQEEVEVELTGETNPAAIPEPGTLRLPMHMLVDRGIVDKLPLEQSLSRDHDETTSDDEEVPSEERPSVPHVLETVRLFAVAYPEGLVVADKMGRTPLLAAMDVRDSLPSLDVIEVLLGKRSPGYEVLPPWTDDLPIHALTDASWRRNPAMVALSSTGQLPLHVAAEEFLSDYSVIESIHDSYPGAIQVQDGRGRTPLHVALNSYRRIPADPRIIALLFSDRVAQVRDDTGQLPFDLLLESAQNLPKAVPRSFSEADSSDGAVSTYQRFFHASILGAAKPARESESRDFLRRLARTTAVASQGGVCRDFCERVAR